MKWKAGLETSLQKVSGLGFCRRRVHSRPFRWELRAAFETPFSVGLRDSFAGRFLACVLEQPSSDDIADFGVVIDNKVLRHSTDDLGDLLLPRGIPVRHLNLTTRQTNDSRCPRRTR